MDSTGGYTQVNCAIVTRMFRAMRFTVTPLRVRNAYQQRRSWNKGNRRKEEERRISRSSNLVVFNFLSIYFLFSFFLIIQICNTQRENEFLGRIMNRDPFFLESQFLIIPMKWGGECGENERRNGNKLIRIKFVILASKQI